MATIPYKTYLSESELPRQWYNLRADMEEQPAPMLNPATGEPLKAEDLYPIFTETMSEFEMDGQNRYIDIPEQVFQYYKTFRPSPLIRAYNLEKYLDTPAKIYYKFEGNNTSGSHKLNAAAPMAYYAKQEGLASLTTETGAGQWGAALAMACAYFGIDLTVYMVKVSAQQKPYRKNLIETYGGKIIASPSETTEVGRKILAENPGTGGSLGCAISEAVEASLERDHCKYALGSVLNQVLLPQSIIGLEAKAAMDKLGEFPDLVIGCAGGGSNLGGLISAYMGDKLRGGKAPAFLAVEPASCPSLTRGRYAYDFCDTGRVTPLAKMYTLGCGFMPAANHSGGLRYHGMSPALSKLYHDGHIDAISVQQTKVFHAAKEFIRCEQILPAPESSHAIYAAMEEAKRCKETGEGKTILFGLTGTGYFDMAAYDQFNHGAMQDYIPTDEELQRGFDALPQIRETPVRAGVGKSL